MIAYVIVGIISIPFIYFLVTYIIHLWSLRRYPPGLFPLPILGNLHQMNPELFKQFHEMSKTYGDVFSISMGMKRAVVINSYEAMETFTKKPVDFSGRPSDIHIFNLLTRNGKDISSIAYGEQWKNLRKLGHLAVHGNTAADIENLVAVEVDELSKRVAQSKEETIDVKKEIGIIIMNLINCIVFGARYEIGDNDAAELKRFSDTIPLAMETGGLCSYLPWLRLLPIKMAGIELMNKALRIRDRIIKKKVQEHESTFDPQNLRDYTDKLLDLFKRKEEWKRYGIGKLDNDHFELLLSIIFQGGLDTTLALISWALNYLLQWPQYQDKIYEEIQRVVGEERIPFLKDKDHLHILQAFIQETLRFSTILPISLKAPTKDTSIQDHFLPKDAILFCNLWSVHHDERYWDKPNEFNPNRWLDGEGKYSSHLHPNFVPFGAGNRSCLGEILARKEIFLFLSQLIRTFEILPDPSEPFPSSKPIIGFILHPSDFTAMLKLRGK